MAFNIGDQVIFQGRDVSRLMFAIRGGKITKITDEFACLDGHHDCADQVYLEYLYPDTPECREFLRNLIGVEHHIQMLRDYARLRTAKFNVELRKAGLK